MSLLQEKTKATCCASRHCPMDILAACLIFLPINQGQRLLKRMKKLTSTCQHSRQTAVFQSVFILHSVIITKLSGLYFLTFFFASCFVEKSTYAKVSLLPYERHHSCKVNTATFFSSMKQIFLSQWIPAYLHYSKYSSMFQTIIRKECFNGNRTDKQLVQKSSRTQPTSCGLCSTDLIHSSAESRTFAWINDTSAFRKQSALKVI